MADFVHTKTIERANTCTNREVQKREADLVCQEMKAIENDLSNSTKHS